MSERSKEHASKACEGKILREFESRFIRRIISFKRISRLKLFYSAELAQVGSTVCFMVVCSFVFFVHRMYNFLYIECTKTTKLRIKTHLCRRALSRLVG